MCGYISRRTTHGVHVLSIHSPKSEATRGMYSFVFCWTCELRLENVTRMVLQVFATASHGDHLGCTLPMEKQNVFWQSSFSRLSHPNGYRTVTQLATARDDWAPKLGGFQRLYVGLSVPISWDSLVSWIPISGLSISGPPEKSRRKGFRTQTAGLRTSVIEVLEHAETSPSMPTNIQWDCLSTKARKYQPKTPKHIKEYCLETQKCREAEQQKQTMMLAKLPRSRKPPTSATFWHPSRNLKQYFPSNPHDDVLWS